MSLATDIAELVKAKTQGRHASGRYALAGHAAETRLLASGKRALPLHRAVNPDKDDRDDA